MTGPTAEQHEALDIARQLITAGIPVFSAPPCLGQACARKGHETGKVEYDLPPKWQLTVPSMVWLDRWRPGWALGAVGGHRADFLDEDPRHGGSESIAELIAAGHMPRVFGVQETPSGGFHHLMSPLGERETNGFMPGLDYQGGMPDGKGRAFIWIAPTVRRSKAAATLGEPRAYRWLQVPDLDYLAEFEGSDDTGEELRGRILARKTRDPSNAERTGDDRERTETREFTETEAREFCKITLSRVEAAERGGIEEAANAAACQLSHFVPDFWTEGFAFSVLRAALDVTGYDPTGPSEWTAEKFHDVLAGVDGRAPGDWVAVRRPESVDEVTPETDDVDALLAEMLSPQELAKRKPPRPLVKGLLNFDSESWIIGPPGSKKTFVAQDIAGHVALGRPWQGLKVTQARVVMVVAEGAGGMSTRMLAWEKRNGPMSADGEQSVYILPRPVQARDFKAWAILTEACRRLEPGLVVIDTQARVTVGLEENSATDMGVYIEAVRAVREATGACVLTVHHTGRKGGDARGSSAIDGAQHTEVKVTSEGLRGVLATEKQKDMEMLADMPLVFEVIEVGIDDDGDPVTSLVLAPDAFSRARGPEEGAPEREEPWERFHGAAQVHLIKVLRDQGGSVGLTKADARASLVERFHDGDQKRLARSTYATAWMKVLEKVAPDGSAVAINLGGQRWGVDPIALESLSLDLAERASKVET